MTVATFDTLKYANTLKAAGVPDKQAEAQASVLADALAINLKDLVTKDDLSGRLNEMEQRLDSRLKETEQRLDAKIDLLRTELTGEIKLPKWMLGAIMSLLVALVVRQFFFPVR